MHWIVRIQEARPEPNKSHSLYRRESREKDGAQPSDVNLHLWGLGPARAVGPDSLQGNPSSLPRAPTIWDWGDDIMGFIIIMIMILVIRMKRAC